MNRTSKRILTVLVALLSSSFPLAGQILVVDKHEMGEVSNRAPHTGLTLSGSTGLCTIQTPDFQDDRSIFLGYKGGILEQDIVIGGTKYESAKNEHSTTIAYNINPNLEVSVNHFRYQRCASPSGAGLDFDEDATAFGMKYSTHNGKQDMTMGFSFAPMTSEELNRADLTQVETLRQIYLTTAEDIGKSFTGYLHLKACMTADQKIKMSNGQEYLIDRKEFLVSGVGLEYRPQNRWSVFGEAMFANYRDLFRTDSTRVNLNGGIRMGSDRIQLELLGRSLESSPWMMGGVNVAF